MMKLDFNPNRYYYLSGMPRTGSTLLGSLLNQHPDVFVSSTSPLNRIMHDLFASLQENGLRGTDWHIDDMNQRIFKYMFECWYEGREEKYVFDKSRGWGFNIQAVQAFINENPKVLITYRPIPEIITSFLTLIEKDKKNYVDLNLYKSGLEINTENRAKHVWNNFYEYGYKSAKIAFENFGDIIHVVNYDDLVNDTEQTMDNIWNYLEIDKPNHNFDHVETYLERPDENWGISNLHIVRPVIEKVSRDPKQVLGDELFEYFSQFNIVGETNNDK